MPQHCSSLLPSLLVLSCAAAGTLQSQVNQQASQTAAVSSSRQFETREQLEVQVRQADSQGRSSEAWLLRSRLDRGDFQEGDRVVLEVEGSSVVRDTLRVRTGKLLQFPQMGDLSLNGVLRSELTEAVRAHLAKFLNQPMVRATPLLPIAVMGAVTRPGYHYAPADVVVRDMVMLAGGPATQGDLNKAVIRRGGEVIWKAEDVRVALADGLSLDALHLRAGDEIFVPEKRRLQITSITTIVSTTLAVTLALIQLSR